MLTKEVRLCENSAIKPAARFINNRQSCNSRDLHPKQRMLPLDRPRRYEWFVGLPTLATPRNWIPYTSGLQRRRSNYCDNAMKKPFLWHMKRGICLLNSLRTQSTEFYTLIIFIKGILIRFYVYGEYKFAIPSRAHSLLWTDIDRTHLLYSCQCTCQYSIPYKHRQTTINRSLYFLIEITLIEICLSLLFQIQ